MPHRDPETGLFVAEEDSMDFDRFEEVHDDNEITVAASELGGTTGTDYGEQGQFESFQLYDVDQLLDRDEVAVLIWAEHHMYAGFASTATADSTIRAVLEWSASPDDVVADPINTVVDIPEQSGDFNIQNNKGEGSGDVSADIIGRVLSAVGYGPITDGTNGVGGAGTAGVDDWQGQPVAAPTFDARDDLFLQGAIDISNASDLSAHVGYNYRHVYGVMEDFF